MAAKYYNNRIKTGKVAGSVFSVRYGEVIERAYNPIVANPNTEGQIESRAKMKMMSQLAAVFGGTIAIRRVGGASPRNLFVKANYPAATFADGVASVNMEAIQLTSGVLAIPSLTLERSNDGVMARLQGNVSSLDYVVYITMIRSDDNKLRLFNSKVVSEAGVDGAFQTAISTSQLGGYDLLVYAYGVRLNNEATRVRFESIVLDSAEAIVRLATQSTTSETDVTFTETRYAELLPA